MRSIRRFRTLLAALLAISLVAAACGSGDDASQDAEATPIDETDGLDDNGDGGDGGDGDEPETDADTSAVDPDTVQQLAGSLVGVTIEDQELTCLVEGADGDSQLTELYQRIGTEGYELTPEAFTALAVSAHDCIGNEVLATSLTPISGATTAESALAFSGCVAEQISATPNGDLAYTGLSALLVGVALPEGSRESAYDAAVTCVEASLLAGQLAATREQSTGFTEEVDRDCVTENIDDGFVEAFWTAVIYATGEVESLIPEIVDPCTSVFDSGLPTEIPVDFVPWSGTGALAGVDPASRNGVYETAPPDQLEDGVDYQAVLTTDDGEIIIDLYEQDAPITVNSFVSLARDGFYDGTRFHRVLDGFMAQGGDPTGTGTGGPGFTFEDEESGMTPVDDRGLLAMANSGVDTNGSQFFITFAAAEHLTGLHTVFGEVVSGDDVLESIERRDPSAPNSRGEELISVVITES